MLDADLNREATDAVRHLATERLSDAKIVGIDVTADRGYDDDEILRITVVYDSPDERLHTDGTVGFVRHLRPRLEEMGLTMFPVMSFVSKADYERSAI